MRNKAFISMFITILCSLTIIGCDGAAKTKETADVYQNDRSLSVEGLDGNTTSDTAALSAYDDHNNTLKAGSSTSIINETLSPDMQASSSLDEQSYDKEEAVDPTNLKENLQIENSSDSNGRTNVTAAFDDNNSSDINNSENVISTPSTDNANSRASTGNSYNGSSSNTDKPVQTPKPTPKPNPTPALAPHTHSWVPITETVHHDAVTKQVWIEDTAAWEEPVYIEEAIYDTETKVLCRYCNEEFDTSEQWPNHSKAMIDQEDYNHGSYSVVWHNTFIGMNSVLVDKIHHDAVGHYETQTIKPAYDENITTGYKCSSCGEMK